MLKKTSWITEASDFIYLSKYWWVVFGGFFSRKLLLQWSWNGKNICVRSWVVFPVYSVQKNMSKHDNKLIWIFMPRAYLFLQYKEGAYCFPFFSQSVYRPSVVSLMSCLIGSSFMPYWQYFSHVMAANILRHLETLTPLLDNLPKIGTKVAFRK